MSVVNIPFIVERRKQLKLSQNDMAMALGLKSGAPAYIKYEQGAYRFRADMMPRLAEVLDCKIDDFFCKAD